MSHTAEDEHVLDIKGVQRVIKAIAASSDEMLNEIACCKDELDAQLSSISSTLSFQYKCSASDQSSKPREPDVGRPKLQSNEEPPRLSDSDKSFLSQSIIRMVHQHQDQRRSEKRQRQRHENENKSRAFDIEDDSSLELTTSSRISR
mgnify:CR=1 FL=1